MRLSWMRWLSSRCCGAALAFVVPQVANAISFSDSEFADANWSATIFQYGPGGSATSSQSGAGGSPGAYRDVSMTVNATSPPGATDPNRAHVYVAHERLGFSYDPSSSGAVQSIDLLLDARFISGNAGPGGQGVQALVIQGGSFFTTVSPNQFNVPETSWTSKSLLGLEGDDFQEIDGSLFSPFTDPASHPDFSAAGGPFSVGFLTRLNTAGNGSVLTNRVGYDNWQVVITPVPEPGTALLVAMSLTGLGFVRRRSARLRR